MRGHRPVTRLGDGRNAGDVLIEPQHPLPAWDVSQRAKNGFGPAPDAMIRRDELYGFAKILGWNFRKLTGHFLEGGVRDEVRSQTFPIINPETTKTAITVVNQQRAIS